MEIESIKKTKTEGILEMKILRIWIDTTEANFINKIWEMEEIILGIEATIEKMNISVKENVKPKRGPEKKYKKFGILRKSKA